MPCAPKVAPVTDTPAWIEHPLQSDRPLIVYIDFKSPYAYLAMEPTRAMAQKLNVPIDWRPFVLDIPSFLGSAKLDGSGKVVEQQRTPAQWSGVKYAYFDCRRYANLRGVTVRGTVKIWDCDLAATGMLWAKEQGDRVLDAYVDAVFEPFWKRALDIEDIDVIIDVLHRAGADTAGFRAFVTEVGRRSNELLQKAAFDAGVYGVPTYVVGNQIYFGREHLPRIGWHLSGEQGAPPDIAYPVSQDQPTAQAALGHTLEICVDFGNPLSYLCIDPVLALRDETGVRLDWHALSQPPHQRPIAPLPTDDRATRHRRRRAEAWARDIERYAPHPLGDLYAPVDCLHATMGLLWLRQAQPALLDDYVQMLFRRRWRDHASINELQDIADVLEALGTSPEPFDRFASGAGPAAARRAQQALEHRGVMGTPTFFVDQEPFLGRAHLPLIRRRLTTRSPQTDATRRETSRRTGPDEPGRKRSRQWKPAE